MLLEFSVKNFRSINDLQTLSFVSTGLKSSPKNINVDIENITEESDLKIFKTIGIYGANASGKTNIVKALDFFISSIVKQPSSLSSLQNINQPYFLKKNMKNQNHFTK